MTTLQLLRRYEGKLRMGRWKIPPEPGVSPIYECQSCGFRFTEPGTYARDRGRAGSIGENTSAFTPTST